MSSLLIELDRVSVRRDLLDPLREELEAAGIDHGRLALGDVTSDPSQVYFLWHDNGDVPISMMIDRDSLKTDTDTRAAAREFIAKWKQARQSSSR